MGMKAQKGHEPAWGEPAFDAGMQELIGAWRLRLRSIAQDPLSWRGAFQERVFWAKSFGKNIL